VNERRSGGYVFTLRQSHMTFGTGSSRLIAYHTLGTLSHMGLYCIRFNRYCTPVIGGLMNFDLAVDLQRVVSSLDDVTDPD